MVNITVNIIRSNNVIKDTLAILVQLQLLLQIGFGFLALIYS
jgi:hypothetical protein